MPSSSRRLRKGGLLHCTRKHPGQPPVSIHTIVSLMLLNSGCRCALYLQHFSISIILSLYGNVPPWNSNSSSSNGNAPGRNTARNRWLPGRLVLYLQTTSNSRRSFPALRCVACYQLRVICAMYLPYHAISPQHGLNALLHQDLPHYLLYVCCVGDDL
jgi:hypothetical protein